MKRWLIRWAARLLRPVILEAVKPTPAEQAAANEKRARDLARGLLDCFREVERRSASERAR